MMKHPFFTHPHRIRPPILHVSSTSTGRSTTGLTLDCDIPASIGVNNLLVAFSRLNGAGTLTMPAGWNLHGSSLSTAHRLWWKIADGAEGSQVTVTRSGTGGLWNAIIAQYSGTHPTAPIEAISGVNSAGTSNLTLPALTPSTSTDLFSLVTSFANGTWSFPGTQSEDFDRSSSGVTAYGTAGAHDTNPVTPGVTTGTRVCTTSVGPTNLGGYNMLLLPA